MKLQKRLAYSVVFAILLFFISMFIPFVPCQTAPLVPNPSYQWTTCTLNPDTTNIIGESRIYFGYTESITDAYFILIMISFVLAMGTLHVIAKTKK
ncbi:hypothetical protein CMI37_26355 [Candidatus Pacearchaeota archaeon]|nr:hypothetical protein [Candidatus Pacearchaeota archaeon]|tara:strand:+ start:204 stop:491 length:288 start_codon:yes stop_codon:yes gene_type:complete